MSVWLVSGKNGNKLEMASNKYEKYILAYSAVLVLLHDPSNCQVRDHGSRRLNHLHHVHTAQFYSHHSFMLDIVLIVIVVITIIL